MQLNAVVTLVLAVVVLREPCTILQLFGGYPYGRRFSRDAARRTTRGRKQARQLANVYTTPCRGLLLCLDRSAHVWHDPDHRSPGVLDVGPLSGLAGGSIAYAAATVVVTLGLLIPSLRRNLMT